MQNLTAKQARVLSVMSEIDGMSPKEIKEATGYKFVRKTLRTLESRGLVYSEGYFNSIVYFLTAE